MRRNFRRRLPWQTNLLERTDWPYVDQRFLMVGVAMASAVAPVRYAGYRHRLVSALLRCHHENTAWHEGDLLAPTLRALRFHRYMLGDGLGALEPLSAFLATVLISRHGLTIMTQGAGSFGAITKVVMAQPNGKVCLWWGLAPVDCHTHAFRASLSDALS